MRKAVKYIITPLAISTAMISVRIENAFATIDITSDTEYKSGEIVTIHDKFCKSQFFTSQLSDASDQATNDPDDEQLQQTYKELKDLLSKANDDNEAYDKIMALLDKNLEDDFQKHLKELYNSLTNNSISTTEQFKIAFEKRYSPHVDEKVPATRDNFTKYYSAYLAPSNDMNSTYIHLDKQTKQPRAESKYLQLQYALLDDIKTLISDSDIINDKMLTAWQVKEATQIFKKNQYEAEYIKFLKGNELKDNADTLTEISTQLGAKITSEDIAAGVTMYDYLKTKDYTNILTPEAQNKLEKEISSDRQSAISELITNVQNDLGIELIQTRNKIKVTEDDTLETLTDAHTPELIINKYHAKLEELNEKNKEQYKAAYAYFTGTCKMTISKVKEGDMGGLLNSIGNQYNNLRRKKVSAATPTINKGASAGEIKNLNDKITLLQKQNESHEKKEKELEGQIDSLKKGETVENLLGVIKYMGTMIDKSIKDEIYTACGITAKTKAINPKHAPHPIIAITKKNG